MGFKYTKGEIVGRDYYMGYHRYIISDMVYSPGYTVCDSGNLYHVIGVPGVSQNDYWESELIQLPDQLKAKEEYNKILKDVADKILEGLL